MAHAIAILSYLAGDVMDRSRDVTLIQVQLPQAKLLVLGSADTHILQSGQLSTEFDSQLGQGRNIVDMPHHFVED